MIELGGGRTRPQDPVDHAVGITNIAGRNWNGSDPICRILARDEASLEAAKVRVLGAMEEGVKVASAVIERVEVSS